MSSQKNHMIALLATVACVGALTACGSDEKATEEARANNASCQIENPKTLEQQANAIATLIHKEHDRITDPDRYINPSWPEGGIIDPLWANSGAMSKTELEREVIDLLFELIDDDFDLQEGEVALLHYPSPLLHESVYAPGSVERIFPWAYDMLEDVGDFEEWRDMFSPDADRYGMPYTKDTNGIATEATEPVVLAFNPCGTYVRDTSHMDELAGDPNSLVGSELISAVAQFSDWTSGWLDNGYAALNSRFSDATEGRGALIMTSLTYEDHPGEFVGARHRAANDEYIMYEGELPPYDTGYLPDGVESHATLDALKENGTDVFLPSLRMLAEG